MSELQRKIEQLEQIHSDMQTSLRAHRVALDDARDITNAVGARLASAYAADRQRVAELTATACDLTRSPIVRQMAERDRAMLKYRTYAPSDGEREAFDAALAEADAALKDAAALTDQFKEAQRQAEATLAALRREVVGDAADLAIRAHWAITARDAFDGVVKTWEKADCTADENGKVKA